MIFSLFFCSVLDNSCQLVPFSAASKILLKKKSGGGLVSLTTDLLSTNSSWLLFQSEVLTLHFNFSSDLSTASSASSFSIDLKPLTSLSRAGDQPVIIDQNHRYLMLALFMAFPASSSTSSILSPLLRYNFISSYFMLAFHSGTQYCLSASVCA